jgi:hypothetical protein
MEVKQVEFRRIGKSHRYDLHVDDRFVAHIGRGFYSRALGAIWCVGMLPEYEARGGCPGSFPTKEAAAEAVLLRLVAWGAPVSGAVRV